MPENNALEGLCRGMLEALKYYGNEEYGFFKYSKFKI